MKAPPLNFLRHIVSNGTQESGNFFRPHSVASLRLLPLVLFLVFLKFETNAPNFQREKGLDKSCIILGAITVNNDLTRIRD